MHDLGSIVAIAFTGLVGGFGIALIRKFILPRRS